MLNQLNLDNDKNAIEKKCPFHKMSAIVNKYSKLTHNLIGAPTIKHKNILSDINGTPILFLFEKVSKLLGDEIFCVDQNTSIQLELNNENSLDISYKIDASELATRIFENLAKEFPEVIKVQNGTIVNTSPAVDEQLYLLLAAIESYDGLFIHLIGKSHGIEEYNNELNQLKKIMFNLAQLPDIVQQMLIKDGIGKSNINKRYNTYCQSGDYTQNPYSQDQYSDMIYKHLILDKVNYGKCPALEDGILMKVFNILSILYGKIYISNIKSSQK